MFSLIVVKIQIGRSMGATAQVHYRQVQKSFEQAKNSTLALLSQLSVSNQVPI